MLFSYKALELHLQRKLPLKSKEDSYKLLLITYLHSYRKNKTKINGSFCSTRHYNFDKENNTVNMIQYYKAKLLIAKF